MKNKTSAIIITLTFLSLLSACQSAARKVVYSAWEQVGVEKRDLLKDRIEDARDDQKEAGKTFNDALERLRALYQVDGGELGKRYDKLKSAYDESLEDAEQVKKSIQKMETVAGDLFKEWETESGEIQTAELRAKSRERLAETKTRYQSLHSALKTAEARMDPVLAKLKDQVLYMKHNLNAQAISSLKGAAVTIENDIKQLMDRMNKSITEADQFITHLP